MNLFLNLIPDLFSLSILASLSRSGLPDSRDMLLCRAPLQPHLASSCDNWDQSEASVILYQPIGGQHYPICISQSEASMILYQSIRGQNYHEYIICKHKLSTCWLPCHWALSPRPQTSSCPAVWTQICDTSVISLFLPQYFPAWPAPPAHQAPLCLPDGAVRQPRGAVQVQIHLKNNEIHATGRLHLVNCDKFLSKRNQTRSQSSQQFSCVSNPTLA